MLDHPDNVQTDGSELEALVDPGGLADWIETEPVQALRHFREELVALAADGVPETAPVADRLVDVIAALQGVGDTLRDDDALPSSLEAVFSRCAADLQDAQSLVARTRSRIDAAGAPAVSDAARERVREARSGAAAPGRPGLR